MSGVLQWALNSFRNATECRLKFANLDSMPLNITNSMLCVGGTDLNPCVGDSGGPLTCFKFNKTDNPDERFLCGIASFGNGCRAGRPTIYTDVSKYYDWIRKHIITWSRQSDSKNQGFKKSRSSVPVFYINLL